MHQIVARNGHFNVSSSEAGMCHLPAAWADDVRLIQHAESKSIQVQKGDGWALVEYSEGRPKSIDQVQ